MCDHEDSLPAYVLVKKPDGKRTQKAIARRYCPRCDLLLPRPAGSPAPELSA